MSFVSPDNTDLTNRVASIRADYSTFLTTLRGSVAEVLSGLSTGVHNLMSMNKVVEDIGRAFLRNTLANVLYDLGEVTNSALDASGVESDAMMQSKALKVAEELHKSFAADLKRSIERAVNKDVNTALDFIRAKLSSGRMTATTNDLVHDLTFNISDKAGRPLESVTYVFREVNWAYRQQYNSLMAYCLMSSGIDTASVNGGSKNGDQFKLADFTELQSVYFHHNSKSLLQPLD